jgi:hypothetical protein
MTFFVNGINIREVYKIGMELLDYMGKKEPSRAGEVIVSPVPVISIYENPHHRVLLNAVRDANPFFHFMEGIWMIAGSDQSAFLDHYVSDYSGRFADEGKRLHGAYGHRWVNHFGGLDQVEEAIKILTADPTSRRVVIGMWDPSADLGTDSKDIPCNTHIYFRIRQGKLEMMVNCRSNDIIWGAYGANAVHFSMLQEYMSSRLDLQIGRLYQNSWNYHAYTSIFERCLAGVKDDTWIAPYKGYRPLCSQPSAFAAECRRYVNGYLQDPFRNDVFYDVVFPMQRAYHYHKEKDYPKAILEANEIVAEDWRQACVEWLQRRQKNYELKIQGGGADSVS